MKAFIGKIPTAPQGKQKQTMKARASTPEAC